MSNLFLLTGLSFLIGGFKYFEQPFNREMTQTITMLLFLAVFSLVIPTASYYFLNFGPGGIGAQSRGTATVIITSYGLWLYFDRKTHKDLWRISSKPTGNILWRKEGEEDASRALALTGKMAARRSVDREPKLEEPVENEEPRLTVSVAVVTIIAATSLIAMNMQFFSDSIQGFSRSGFFSGSFRGSHYFTCYIVRYSSGQICCLRQHGCGDIPDIKSLYAERIICRPTDSVARLDHGH